MTAEHNMEEAYITKGFNNLKKALEAFVDHQQYKAHRPAITYESVVPQCGDVWQMTVNDLNNERLAEKEYFIKVMECIRFLACQGSGFRGNDSNGNLTQLFKLLNKNNPTLLTRLDKESHLEPGQHRYRHNDIQNQLIELMAKQVLSKKLESIRSSKFFGIIADECTDISNKELLSNKKPLHRTGNGHVFSDVPGNFVVFVELLLYHHIICDTTGKVARKV